VNNHRPVHTNVLVPSPMEAVRLGREVEQRFVRLLADWLRVRGERLVPPPNLDNDMLRWRQMRVRHKEGDFRHTEAELRSMEAIAQWCYAKQCEWTGTEYKDPAGR
jgi:hypothetical protein